MNIETFAKMRAFQEVSISGNQTLIDHFLDGEQGDQLRAELKLKRIQFDTNAGLAEKLEQVCNLLDCSKRVFLEMAVIEAIKKAETTFMETYKEEMGQEYGVRVEVEAIGAPVEVTK